MEVLHELEPSTSEIMSLVRRDVDRQPPQNPQSYNGRKCQNMDYLARVDGDDYVVSIGDEEMETWNVLCVLGSARHMDTYATQTEQSQNWIAKNQRPLYRAMRLFRPLYAGYVKVEPRDAFDVFETDNDLSRGIVGYTLRRGSNAILHTTGNFTDDPEFFMRAVSAVKPDDLIHRETHFTANEERHFSEIHRPIIDKLAQLIQRDGLLATEALARYSSQFEETGDIGKNVALTLSLNIQLAPAAKSKALFATYHLGVRNHLMIEKRFNENISSFKVIHEYARGGEVETRRYEQPIIYPNMLIVDAPFKGFTNNNSHDKRLFAVSDSDADELNRLLTLLG